MNLFEQPLNRAEYDWLNRINQNIESNLEDSDFLVGDMAKAEFMCERNFYRKFKKLTGTRPGEYLSDKEWSEPKYNNLFLFFLFKLCVYICFGMDGINHLD